MSESYDMPGDEKETNNPDTMSPAMALRFANKDQRCRVSDLVRSAAIHP